MITDLNPNRGKNPNETYGKRAYDVHTAASLAENSVRSKGAKTTPNVYSQRKPKKTSDFARLALAGLGAIAILGVCKKDAIVRPPFVCSADGFVFHYYSRSAVNCQVKLL